MLQVCKEFETNIEENLSLNVSDDKSFEIGWEKIKALFMSY